MLYVFGLIIIGILCIANASYEGGFSVLCSKRKYDGGRKIDIIIFLSLGIGAFIWSYCINTRVYPKAFILVLVAIASMSYILSWLLAKKNKKEYL